MKRLVLVCFTLFLIMGVENARAALVIEYWFQQAGADVGYVSGENYVAMNEDSMDNNGQPATDTVASAYYIDDYDDYGTASAGLSIVEDWGSESLMIQLFTNLELCLEGATIENSYAHGETYFQIAAHVTDESYQFDFDYQLYPDLSEDDSITQKDHFVNTYFEDILIPQEEWYLLAWGEVDYTLEKGESYFAYPVTELGITLTQIPSVPLPTAAWLFGSGIIGLVGIRRKLRR